MKQPYGEWIAFLLICVVAALAIVLLAHAAYRLVVDILRRRC